MQKKTIIWTTMAATAAAAITIYFLSKRTMAFVHHPKSKKKSDGYPIRSKNPAIGEYTL